jgi:hypothetical protein
MSKYNNLKKLYSDIEILESAGLYKAASVLHKKFVKEAQQDPANLPSTDQANQPDDYIYNSQGQKAPILYMLQQEQFSAEEEERLINTGKGTDISGAEWTYNANKSNVQAPMTTNSVGQAAGPMTTPNSSSNFDNTFAGLGSAMNAAAAPKKNPILDEKEESAVYRRVVDQIKSILSRKNLPAAQKLAKDYENHFSNPKRQTAFKDQITRIFSQFNQKSPFGSASLTQPVMSDEEGETLTQLVNQNVATNSSPAPTQTTQPNANKPSVAPSAGVNDQLFQVVSNFYNNRYVPQPDANKMYSEIKADPAKANRIRFHIKASNSPNKNQLLSAFESKIK